MSCAYITKSFVEAFTGIEGPRLPLIVFTVAANIVETKRTLFSWKQADTLKIQNGPKRQPGGCSVKSSWKAPETSSRQAARRGKKRARGRAAQRTYMLRKQAEADRLRQRITSLEDAIEGMSNEFLAFGERVEDASRGPLAPQILCDLKRTTERFLKMARAAEAVASDGDDSGHEASSILSSTKEFLSSEKFSTELTSISEPCLAATLRFPMPLNFGTVFPSSSSSGSVSTLQPGAPRQSPDPSGRFSPRLGYGLSLNSTPQATRLINIWTHYLAAGPNSFAMRLYKDTLTLMFKALTGELSIPGFIPRIGRYRFRYEQTDDFLEQVRSTLTRMSLEEQDPNYQSTGAETMTSNHKFVLFGPSHPVMTQPLRAMIHRDANREIGELDQWLDPWNTQEYLVNRWGLQLTWATVQISDGTLAAVGLGGAPRDPNIGLRNQYPWENLHSVDVRGFFPDMDLPTPPNEEHLILNCQSLAEDLIQGSICFGEGPRFFKDKIDAAVQQFVATLGLAG
ncbi:uncharacterized protein PAC_13726 [Phialocephala subalpina]|uniref:BZIP domain-containing protein n=1 Tax=Phialocephala subalpina TaxID=576137 RepID=A0A1L7XFK3_9HELO|nr:uncharacterized protein PAC_13726 [Phialocephala subalpina]